MPKTLSASQNGSSDVALREAKDKLLKNVYIPQSVKRSYRIVVSDTTGGVTLKKKTD